MWHLEWSVWRIAHVCHCAASLADGLANKKQVPSDSCERSWRAEGVCRTTARASAFVSLDG
jgi:hypothetical protein